MSQATVVIRGSLTTVICSKVMDLDIQASDETIASTLMSVDIERICMVTQQMHQVWANPLELALAV